MSFIIQKKIDEQTLFFLDDARVGKIFPYREAWYAEALTNKNQMIFDICLLDTFEDAERWAHSAFKEIGYKVIKSDLAILI